MSAMKPSAIRAASMPVVAYQANENPSNLDVDAILATMKQSVQQLDDILQQLCETTAATGSAREDGDGATIAHVQPVPALANKSNVPVDAYFEVTAQSFQSEHDDPIMVIGEQALRQMRTTNATERQTDGEPFGDLESDVTFLFAAPASRNPDFFDTFSQDGDASTNFVWEPSKLSTFTQFQQRMGRFLSEIDCKMPAEITAAIAHAMASEITANDPILHVIQTLFPVECVGNANVRVEWRRGNRVCKIHAMECVRQRQWGVQVVLTVTCVARAQAIHATTNTDGSSPATEPQLGPALSCAMTSCVFVPKKSYASSPERLAASTSLRLSLVEENEKLAPLASEPPILSELRTAELPEFLAVFHYGGHAALPSSGSDASTSLPASFDSSRGFQKLDINTPLPRNRIIHAACGRLHTLLLNDLGLVFAYGHAMDGCLGHGDSLGRTEVFLAQPKLVEFFFDKAIHVQSIACGGDDLTGFHSAAVDRDGAVYTWGVGIALGLGSVHSKSLPERVTMPRATQSQLETVETDNKKSTGTTKIESIACGSGFCIAVGSDGSAFAWGKWSDGRLGLGAIPILHKSSRQHGSRRQLQRFQLNPRRISATTTDHHLHHQQQQQQLSIAWRTVSCGDAHCVALARDGRVYAWGRGKQGQLGLGDVRDAMAPVLVPSLAKSLSWHDVTAGRDWSMAVDSHGAAWSWGACGGAVLGQFSADDTADRSAVVAQVLLQKQEQLRQQQQSMTTTKTNGTTEMPRFEWLRPQPIPSLGHGDVMIRSVAGGAHHAAAISMQGDLYLWGSPSQGLTSQPTLVASAAMQGTIAEQIFCGGNQVIALTSGSFLARELHQLHSSLQNANDDQKLQENPQRELRNVDRPAGADVVLLVGSGRAVFAHKLVLARRSRVFRDLILNEERTSDNTADIRSRHLTELLLPQLRADIARILIEFLYTDNLTKSLDPLSYLIRDVLRAARQFKIPRLGCICRERIASASYVPLGTLLVDLEAEADDSANDGDGFDAVQGHSLNQDLAFAFGDATWADVRIVAENQSIPVHRCMLIARSEYFRALLAFHDRYEQLQGDAHSTHQVKELVVEESYIGMLRVLRFIYNDELTTLHPERELFDPEEAEDRDDDQTERLLEDLIAADKYGLVRMKRLCEHHIAVTPRNCVDVLVVADLVHAPHLKQLALAFIQTNLRLLSTPTNATAGSVLQRLATEFPHLLTELHDRTQHHTNQQMLLRDWQKRLETQWLTRQQALEAQRLTRHVTTAFPWVPLIMACVLATLYLTVMNAQESDYSMVVPAVNCAVVGGLLTLAFLGKL